MRIRMAAWFGNAMGGQQRGVNGKVVPLVKVARLKGENRFARSESLASLVRRIPPLPPTGASILLQQHLHATHATRAP